MKSARAAREARYFAVRVIQVAKDDALCRAGFDAGGHVFVGSHLAPFGARFFLRRLQAVVTEAALFRHALVAQFHVGIRGFRGVSLPFGFPPVEPLERVRAGVDAIATADATPVDLRDGALVVFVGGGDGTNVSARRRFTLLAHYRHDIRRDIRIFAFYFGQDLHPANETPHRGEFGTAQWRVRLGSARHHARLTTRAFV